MKKIITISFLLLLFFSQVGYYFYYMFRQHEIKEAVKHELLAKLPESSLEIIDADIHKNDMEWEDEGREFYLHGQMYDVAYTKIVNGKKLIYCLNDRKEGDLLKRFARAVAASNEQGSTGNHGHHIIKFQLSDFLAISQQHIITANEAVPVKYIDHPVALISNTREILTPPPDLIFKYKTRFL